MYLDEQNGVVMSDPEHTYEVSEAEKLAQARIADRERHNSTIVGKQKSKAIPIRNDYVGPELPKPKIMALAVHYALRNWA